MLDFRSFIQGGFECSTHRNLHGRRLDVVAASRHDEFVTADYERLTELGIRTVREGVRWHVVESKPGLRDFSSVEEVFSAANECGIDVLLDLMHFGWPDFLNVFSPGFVNAFESFALAAARFFKRAGIRDLSIIPVNEISYLAWAAGEAGLIFPHQPGRGGELKRQLVKAAIAASRVLKNEIPSVRLLSAEPIIHVAPGTPADSVAAERFRLSMYEATDMVLGRSCPELGGSADLIDVMGVNFYDRNQWVHEAETIHRGDPRYKPLRSLLQEVAERYKKPILISETGAEGDARADWFRYVCEETRAAMRAGTPIRGVCLYPIVNHPGWDDDRHCCNGLWDYADDRGRRDIHLPLADAIAHEQDLFARTAEAA